MKLTESRLKIIKELISKPLFDDAKWYTGTVTDLCDTIESQQQEIGQLKDENISIKKWNACEAEDYGKLLKSDKKRIELEQEIEQLKLTISLQTYGKYGTLDYAAQVQQLQAQNGALRHVLSKAQCYIEDGNTGLDEQIDEALSTTYHNPADVELQRSAREAIIELINDRPKVDNETFEYWRDRAHKKPEYTGNNIKKWVNIVEALEQIDKAMRE
jgi:hypothetical protein